ncbi:MAG: hypothetical protein AB8B80_10385 [Marinicellaceae bacterium]
MKIKFNKTLLSCMLMAGFQVQALEISKEPMPNKGQTSAEVDLRGGGGISLVVDDGTAENTIGDDGQFIWLNRFSPATGDFPFNLEEVQVVFGNNMVNIGDAIEILVYEDTDNDGDPGTNAVLLASFSDVIQNNDGFTFNEYMLDMPVELTGPGDVLIGVVSRASFEGAMDFPATIDEDVLQERSWVASYNSGDVPANPALPGDEQWGTIDSFGLPGNWLIRGFGSSTVPVELINYSID